MASSKPRNAKIVKGSYYEDYGTQWCKIIYYDDETDLIILKHPWLGLVITHVYNCIFSMKYNC